MGCSGEKGRRARGGEVHETLSPLESAGVTPTEAPPLVWDSAAGPALILAADSVLDSAAVLRPEYVEGRYTGASITGLMALSRTRFDLFGRGGALGSTTLLVGQPSVSTGSNDECISWPMVGLSTTAAGWSIGLQTGYAAAVPLDVIEAMSASDSALFVAQVVRLAMLPSSAYDPVFNNIPFVVQHAYRFQTALVEGIIGVTRRSIPSEAMPREEHLFFIAERPVGSSNDYRIAFSTRAAGEEGSTPVVNVLALVVLNRGERPAMIVRDEYGDGGAVAVIERTAPGQWRVIWRSVYAGC